MVYVSNFTIRIPSIYFINKGLTNGETIIYTEYFCGAEYSGSIDRSKVIMYGSYQELTNKLNDYKEIHDKIEAIKAKFDN